MAKKKLRYDPEWLDNLPAKEQVRFDVHMTYKSSQSFVDIGIVVDQIVCTAGSCLIGRSFGKRGRIWMQAQGTQEDIRHIVALPYVESVTPHMTSIAM
jgi:hypothetical protein